MLASPEVDEVNRKLSLATCTTIVGLAGTPACSWVSAKHDGRPSPNKIRWEEFNEQPKIYLSYCRLYGCYPGSRGARRAPEPLDSGAGDHARTTGQGTSRRRATRPAQPWTNFRRLSSSATGIYKAVNGGMSCKSWRRHLTVLASF